MGSSESNAVQPENSHEETQNCYYELLDISLLQKSHNLARMLTVTRTLVKLTFTGEAGESVCTRVTT